MLTIQDVFDPLVAGEVRFSDSVRERLRLKAGNLKMLPAIATRALDIAKDPDCSIDEFTAVVERDASLASDILRMANSLMFGGSRPVMNLYQAVVRLGFRQCKSLIIAASFSSMMKKMTLDEEWVRECLWRHCFATALIGLHLNRTLNIGFQGEEFVAGLIHDIGRMLCATCYPDQFSEIDPMTFEESQETPLHEQMKIETNHCELGVWFARKNSLPDPLIDVIRFHHCPSRAIDNRKLVALIAVSDHMANHLQRFDEAIGYAPASNLAVELLEDCGVTHAERRFVEIAATVMETANRDATEMLAF